VSGRITLGQVAERTDVLVVACNRCDRVERYPIATLIARYGLKFEVPRLLQSLSHHCPKRRSVNRSDLCGICCPELAKLFPLPPRISPRPRHEDLDSQGQLSRARGNPKTLRERSGTLDRPVPGRATSL
jgi:hypothetical protein